MSCASWSDNPFMHGYMVYFLLLSTKILCNKVIELLAILVGKYMVLVTLYVASRLSSCFFLILVSK